MSTPGQPLPPQGPPPQGLYALPQGPEGNWSRIWLNVGPAGMLGVLASVAFVFLLSMFYTTLRSGQETMQKSQDHLFQRLESEQRDNQQREDKMLDRTDRLSKDTMDRWEKSRERSEEVRSEVKAISSKVDAMSADVKAVNVYLKLRDEKGK